MSNDFRLGDRALSSTKVVGSCGPGSWGADSAIDSDGRTIWIADAQRCDGKCFVVHVDEKADYLCRTYGPVAKPEVI